MPLTLALNFGIHFYNAQFMDPFEIQFEYKSRRYTAIVEKRETPTVRYVVYFKDPQFDLKYGQLIYDVKLGQLMNSDEKTLEDAELIAQIGLEIKNGLKEQHEELGKNPS